MVFYNSEVPYLSMTKVKNMITVYAGEDVE